MIRPLHLTDIGALLLFLSSSPINEARTRDRLRGKGVELLWNVRLLKDCLVSGDKQYHLVYADHGFIHGVACLHKCHGPSVWTIERLLLTPGKENVCFELLEKLGYDGGKLGAERLFLRLDSHSPIVDIAKQAGFNHYLTELLYRQAETRHEESNVPQPLSLRPRTSADEHGLFRLYSTATPLQVRSAEGMTLQGWCESRERDGARELILERNGEIAALLRFKQGIIAGQFEIITELGADELSPLVDYSLATLKGRRPIFCLTPEFQQQMRRILEERGFLQVASYSCLNKQLAVRIREPRLVPLRA